MAFDAQTACNRLVAYIASKPSHGRQDLLVEWARIADECTIPEEDFQRALRLTLPALSEALFEQTARTAQPPADGFREARSHRMPVMEAEQPTIAA